MQGRPAMEGVRRANDFNASFKALSRLAQPAIITKINGNTEAMDAVCREESPPESIRIEARAP